MALGAERWGSFQMLWAGVFTIMNYLLPKRGILSMHASANEGKDPAVKLSVKKTRFYAVNLASI